MSGTLAKFLRVKFSRGHDSQAQWECLEIDQRNLWPCTAARSSISRKSNGQPTSFQVNSWRWVTLLTLHLFDRVKYTAKWEGEMKHGSSWWEVVSFSWHRSQCFEYFFQVQWWICTHVSTLLLSSLLLVGIYELAFLSVGKVPVATSEGGILEQSRTL